MRMAWVFLFAGIALSRSRLFQTRPRLRTGRQALPVACPCTSVKRR